MCSTQPAPGLGALPEGDGATEPEPDGAAAAEGTAAAAGVLDGAAGCACALAAKSSNSHARFTGGSCAHAARTGRAAA